MVLNEYGERAKEQLLWLEKQCPYISLHEFIIMPDHVHAILEIDRTKAENGSKIKSLPEIMGMYKTTSSKSIRLAGNKTFKWQRSFHDRIIRDDKARHFIAGYIQTNPQKWRGTIDMTMYIL